MKKRFLACLLALIMIVSVFAVPVSAASSAADYKDCKPGAWYIPAIDYCAKNGVMCGVGDNRMEPERTITRAEFVSMVTRLFKAYKPADISKYKDVPENAWYHDAMALGVQMKIIYGVSETELDPNGPLDREQAWTILTRALALKDGVKSDLKAFNDVDEISKWALGPGAAMVKDGRLNGYPDKTLRPRDYITRAETAQLLMSCFPNLKTGDLGRSDWKDNVLLLPDDKDVHEVKNVTVNGTLLLSTGVADGVVNIRDAKLDRLVCWGGKDVYVYPGCDIEEIVIARADGVCTIHWMGDVADMPVIQTPEGSNPGNIVVDDTGGQIYPKPGDDDDPTPPVHKDMVKFHYTVDGKEIVLTKELKDGLVEPFDDPVQDGYVFDGWYYEPKFVIKYEFTDELHDGDELYGQWYVSEEMAIIEALNAIVAGSTFSVSCETDVLATIGEDSIPCKIKSAETNKKTVSVELVLDDGTVISRIETLEPGQSVDTLPVSEVLEFGNYDGSFVFRDTEGKIVTSIRAKLYVAYMWNRG